MDRQDIVWFAALAFLGIGLFTFVADIGFVMTGSLDVAKGLFLLGCFHSSIAVLFLFAMKDNVGKKYD